MKTLIRIALCCAAIFTAAAVAEEFKITNSVSFGCTTKSDLSELISYLEDEDMGAFKSAFQEKYKSGSCVPFTQGETLIYIDSSGSAFKLRRRGATKAYWLNSQMFKSI